VVRRIAEVFASCTAPVFSTRVLV